MKKTASLLILLAVLLAAGLPGIAPAEEIEQNTIRCSIENGSYIIRIPAADDDRGWFAESMDRDPVLRLGGAEFTDGAFVVRYDPKADGAATVCVRHYYCAAACDQAHTWDLIVKNGAVTECVGGSWTKNPEKEGLSSVLCGEWLEKDTQFTQMQITENEAGGWDVEIASPLTHGAYIFKATVYYDCWENAFLYDKGKFFSVPITDTENADLGEAVIAGSTGSLAFTAEEEEGALLLCWINGESPEEPLLFAPVIPAAEE